ncbi:E3 ubiquitin-protein ligase TRIM45-like [Babylonia areolata]|uniref:E3 ubiquitin-protein ligase TRIM45-like n=1 Tax=Babylonia areolata TaxID=304850 RepID=UPI003FD057CA
MAAAAAVTHPVCPVCHDRLSVPKILPCSHLVCRDCLVTWLENTDNPGSCPLCRVAVLSPASQNGQDSDLASQVDALPTDLATSVVLESESALRGGDVCGCCDDAEAASFCIQCGMKLCSPCVKLHGRFPSFQDHVMEKLNDLSAGRLASHRVVPCVNHSQKPAELYCASHEELICALCAFSAHRSCPEVGKVGDVAAVKREELKEQIQKIWDRKDVVVAKIHQIDAQVSDGKAKFRAMQDEIRDTFDDLHVSLEAERQKLDSIVQEREATFLAERKSCKLDLENLEAALSAHKATAERLVSSAADTPLLGMMGRLMSRLTALESQQLPDDPKTTPESSHGEEMTRKATAVKRVLAHSAKNEGDNCLWCEKKLFFGGAGYASVIKVGDRVKRGKDWSDVYGSQDGSPPGAGTVVKVPSNLKSDYVWVRWDCGRCLNYRMGANDCYDLKLILKD